MCGIAGIINLKRELLETSKIKSMLDTLNPRGPDSTSWISISDQNDRNFFISNENTSDLKNVKLSMGTARLAILDTSNLGLQPMIDRTGNIITVFNGEIFNYKDIKSKLINLGYTFKSKSDSEIIPSAYKAWKENSFNMFNGQFAIAIFDLKKRHRKRIQD